MTASKPPIPVRLAGILACGCTDLELCPQHLDALPPAERREYRNQRRGNRGTQRGRGAAPTTPEETP